MSTNVYVDSQEVTTNFNVSPIWLPVFLLFFYNERELGVGIDPGMALTPLPSSIGRDRTHDQR